MPVGGLKEKILAAFRAGIFEVVIPEENEKDLEEIPDDVREKMTCFLVSHMDQVLKQVLVGRSDERGAPAAGTEDSSLGSSTVAH